MGRDGDATDPGSGRTDDPQNEADENELSELKSNVKNSIERLTDACEKTESDLSITTQCLSSIEKKIANASAETDAFITGTETNLQVLQKSLDKIAAVIIVSSVILAGIAVTISGATIEKVLSATVFILVEIAFLYISSRLLGNSIRNVAKDEREIVGEFKEQIKVTSGQRKGVLLSVKAAREHKQDVWNMAKLFVDLAKDYEPILQKIYARKDKETNLDNFKVTLTNALSMYGFRVRNRPLYAIRKYRPISDEPSIWLNEIASSVSGALGVSRGIVKLAYSDYVDDNEVLRNSWLEITGKENGVSELIGVLFSNGVVETELVDKDLNSYGAVEQLISMDQPFSIGKFRTVYSKFYRELAELKLSLLGALQSYRIKLSTANERAIREFIPSDLNAVTQGAELCELTAARTGLPIDVVRLLYFEHVNDFTNCRRSWAAVQSKDNDVIELVRLLVDNALVDIHPSYRGKPNCNPFLLKVLKTLDEYDLQKVSGLVRGAFESIEIEKMRFVNALSTYDIHLGGQTEQEFVKWLPDDVTTARADICKFLSSALHIPSNVLSLFYYDYAQDVASRRMVLADLKKSGEAHSLAVVLLKSNKPTDYGGVGNEKSALECLEFFIETEEDYDRLDLQSLLFRYHELYQRALSIRRFLGASGFSSIELQKEPETSKTLVLLKGKLDHPILTSMFEIAGFYLSSNLNAESIDERWFQPIAVSCVALYANSAQTSDAREANKQASFTIESTQILYHTIETRDNESKKDVEKKTLLSRIVLDVAKGRVKSFEHIVYFREALNNGFLYPSIDSLLNKVYLSMDMQIKDLGEERKKLEETLQRDRRAVTRMFDLKLSRSAVQESLAKQLVNAYMITVSGAKGAVLHDIIDSQLPRECIELSATDERFKNLLLLAGASEKTKGGRYTRLGIVPLGMSFEEFNGRFEKAFRNAVLKEPKDRQGSYSANLIRILPTEAFFNRVEIAEEIGISDDHPISTIRKLILENYGAVQNIELIASLQNDDAQAVAMINIIKSFLNQETSILGMTEESMKSVLAASKLMDDMVSGRFDRMLKERYDCTSLSDLAVRIWEGDSKSGEKGRIKFRNGFEGNIAAIARGCGARLTAAQIEEVSAAAFIILSDIGRVLSRFEKSA